MEEAKEMLRNFEEEQRDRTRTQTRPAKFEGGRMRPQEEQSIQAVGYVVDLG